MRPMVELNNKNLTTGMHHFIMHKDARESGAPASNEVYSRCTESLIQDYQLLVIQERWKIRHIPVLSINLGGGVLMLPAL